MSFPINTGIPAAGNDPAADQPIMQSNFANISAYLSVDHVAPGTSGAAGYHTVIHLNQTSPIPPASVAAVGELFINTVTSVTSDTALFYQTGKGLIFQMTANVSPLRAQNGFTFLPGPVGGAILMNWGQVAITTSPQVVNFTQQFSSNAYTVVVTPIAANSATLINPVVSVQTNTNFTLRYSGGGTLSAFNWIAIGPA